MRKILTLEIYKLRFELFPGGLDIYKRIPKSNTDYWLATHTKALEQNPNDNHSRLMLANVLRMDGQISKAMLEYEKLVQVNDPCLSRTAAEMLKEYKGQKDCTPVKKWQFWRRIFLKNYKQ